MCHTSDAANTLWHTTDRRGHPWVTSTPVRHQTSHQCAVERGYRAGAKAELLMALWLLTQSCGMPSLIWHTTDCSPLTALGQGDLMSNQTTLEPRAVAAPAPEPDLATLPVDAPPAPAKGRLGSVFWTSVGISALFVAWGVLFTDNMSAVTTSSLNWVTGTFGWAYLVVTLAILVFLVFLAFSPAGDLRLGADHDRPEFSTLSWFAMILSAVMGIGLVSYGVAEP